MGQRLELRLDDCAPVSGVAMRWARGVSRPRPPAAFRHCVSHSGHGFRCGSLSAPAFSAAVIIEEACAGRSYA